jgi:tRNA(Ile)-lysidine synthase
VHPLQKRFHDFIKEKQLISSNDKVLLAVSGGLDSMAMATLFLNAKFNFSIAHCNFGLRSEESDGDEELVKKWADSNTIERFVKKIDLGDDSVQLAARNARYQWFDELIQEFNFNKLATAHHLNDSLETSLINLIRGTGIKGIGGIKPKIGIVVRPLLFVSKEELRSYALEVGLSWREDSSNTKNDYDRNLIRNVIVPKLKELNPSLSETFRNTSERLQLTNQFLQQKVEEVKNTFLKEENNLIELRIDWIRTDSDFLILSEIVSAFGFNYITSKEIHAAIGKSGKVFSSKEFELSIDRSSIFIRKTIETKNEEVQILDTGNYKIYDHKLDVSISDRQGLDFASSKNIVFLDAAKIQFPFTVRKWKKGDRFRPFGMKGTKKVSDYLIDKKVPLALKNKVLVMTQRDNIVWLIGYQISENFKIDEETESVLRIEIKSV